VPTSAAATSARLPPPVRQSSRSSRGNIAAMQRGLCAVRSASMGHSRAYVCSRARAQQLQERVNKGISNTAWWPSRSPGRQVRQALLERVPVPQARHMTAF